METNESLSTSWLNGKYEVDGLKVEINTSLSYVEIEDKETGNVLYYAQGDEADETIDEINYIANTDNTLPISHAVVKWVNLYL